MASAVGYLELANGHARDLIDGLDRLYVIALRLWKLGMDACCDDEQRDAFGPLWWLWGALSDLVDTPGPDQAGREAAADPIMRLAAQEWLALGSEQGARDAYFVRWGAWANETGPGGPGSGTGTPSIS